MFQGNDLANLFINEGAEIELIDPYPRRGSPTVFLKSENHEILEAEEIKKPRWFKTNQLD